MYVWGGQGNWITSLTNLLESESEQEHNAEGE